MRISLRAQGLMLSPVRPLALSAAVLDHFATGAEVEAGKMPIQHHLRMPRQVGARLLIPTALHVACLVKPLFTSFHHLGVDGLA